MNYWIEHYHRPTTPQEQTVYDHLLYWVQMETPREMLERFRALFIIGFNYSDFSIQTVLDQLVTSSTAEDHFKLFFNRCCHILINRWQSRPQSQGAILEFINLLENPIAPPVAGLGRSFVVRRLRQLVQGYLESDQYQRLRRLVLFIVDPREASETNRPLFSLIRRYPYLYQHCLLSEDSPLEQQQSIRDFQTQAQKRFEVDLSQYLTYRIRRGKAASTVIQPIKNPTLLTDLQLDGAFKQFIGRVNEKGSYQDMAQQFLLQTKYTQNYKTFKDDLYEYLIDSVDTKFGQGRFNNQLYGYLKNVAAQNHDQPLNEFLLVRTCSQMMNFLVVESSQRPQHFVFMDLITNLGTTATIGLLLKIVLVCKKVKPYLEKRFAILFGHYESHSCSGVNWLVTCLENLNIAWSTHFGSIDFSFVKLVL